MKLHITGMMKHGEPQYDTIMLHSSQDDAAKAYISLEAYENEVQRPFTLTLDLDACMPNGFRDITTLVLQGLAGTTLEEKNACLKKILQISNPDLRVKIKP